MDAAFQFDMVMNIGKALDTMLAAGEWRQINYTDCFSFVSTDPDAMLRATSLREEIKKVKAGGNKNKKHYYFYVNLYTSMYSLCSVNPHLSDNH